MSGTTGRRAILLALLAVALVPSVAAAKPGEVHAGRARVAEVLRRSDAWSPPPDTVVYVLGGNFDYGWFQRSYMSPARTAARVLGLPVIDSTANPNGSVRANAARVRSDLERILAERPGATILVAANSKGFADWQEAMAHAPLVVRRARQRIGVFALTPNWRGTRLAGFVLRHRWLERAAQRLLSRKRAPWDRRSLGDITPAARRRAIAGYRGTSQVRTKLIVATAQLGRTHARTDLLLPVEAQIPSEIPHERWSFDRATHGSFTSAGWRWSRSTRLHKAAFIELATDLAKKRPRQGRRAVRMRAR